MEIQQVCSGKQLNSPVVLYVISSTKRRNMSLMDELHILVEMLEKLRPRLWKRFLPSLVIIGMVYIQFFDLPHAFKITSKEIMISTAGLATLFFVWFDYYFSVKTYHKYQNKLISLTEPNKNKTTTTI
jgi:hypothetical protein